MKKVIVLGSGALKIGQAGEFDYSGSQAIKALKEEGIRTVVINPNIATVQTSAYLADEVYFLPITPYFVEQIIQKERPDGILLSFGGQTALNCGVALHRLGVFKKYQVKILGTPIESIILTEDRRRFANHLRKIGASTPTSIAVTTVESAKRAAKKIGYPVMVRSAYTLGGQGSGIMRNEKELTALAEEAFANAPQILIEKYLHHFKEIEYEVVRDADDNCITVCNMENFDPLGIHTGESIVVAPSQTLNNFEYHTLRQASIDIVRSLGIVGECNIQFALNPNPSREHRAVNDIDYEMHCVDIEDPTQDHIDGKFLDYYVIEVNARLSRSSALASKATGYPLAYVAAKIALGKKLNEIPNQVTRVTQSFFEPALDYCVVKIPRWDIEKFQGAHEKIGTSMKSVGEVMGIGRTFPEALQKAVRMLEIKSQGVADWTYISRGEEVMPLKTLYEDHIVRPTPRRLFAIAYALYSGTSMESIHTATGIDLWFLERICEITDGLHDLARHDVILKHNVGKLERSCLELFKQLGFSDAQIAEELHMSEESIRTRRRRLGVMPSIFQIDTLASEFPAVTNYLYCTYHGKHNDVVPLGRDGVMVLGSGPYRIGSSVEFDWSCVSAARRLSHHRRKSIIVNSNPETVSTDYDMSDRLYFEELTLERVLDIYEFENSEGILISVGGQTPNNLARGLASHRAQVLGTDPTNIDRAEDRGKFSEVLDKLGIEQPKWTSVTTIGQAIKFAADVGYPVLLRPSYVLSGSAMKICYTDQEVEVFLKEAAGVTKKYPVTVSKFIVEAKEIEFDAVACHGKILTYGISEHIEQAGVHSGDATIVFPASRIYIGTQQQIIRAAQKLAKEFNITGPFNIQFLGKNNNVSIIEMNLRASRTFPLISKAIGINISSKIVDAVFNDCSVETYAYPIHSVVKVPQFSFARLQGADPVLHVEMTSTGEVGCFGQDREEAYLKSLLSVGLPIPKKTVLLAIGDVYKEEFVDSARMLDQLSYQLYATDGTASLLARYGIPAKRVRKGHEGGENNVIKLLEARKFDLVINLLNMGRPRRNKKTSMLEHTDGYTLRRAAADYNVPLMTDFHAARLLIQSLAEKKLKDLEILPWSSYVDMTGKEE